MLIKKTYYFIFLYFALVLLLVLSVGCDYEQGLEIVVSNAEDSGEGSLRWALETAETGDTIIFDPEMFSPDDPATINIQSKLPGLDQGSVTIDASNAGVILNGAFAGEKNVNGLEIVSSNNTIRGLQIINFQNGAGIALSAEAKDNLIGGDRDTGTGPCGQGNQLSANETGISLEGTSVTGNIIIGNLIGTNENGQMPYRNIGNNNGITISKGASANTIGDNIVAFNEIYGAHILGNSSESNTITRNRIFSNGSKAIYLEGGNAGLEAPVITEFNIYNGTVKGSACAGCTIEVFSSNGREGKFFVGNVQVDEDGEFSFSGGSAQAPRFTVTVTDAEGNTSEFSAPTEVREIVVGSTEDSGEGTLRSAMQNPRSGDIITFDPEIFPPDAPATIYLESELPYIRENYITIDASNAGVILDGINIPAKEVGISGLELLSNGNVIQGLHIVNFYGSCGIYLGEGAKNNLIGGNRNSGLGPLGQGNLVSKVSTGIGLSGAGVYYNVISGNLIGTGPEGTESWGNDGHGINIIDGSSFNVIGPDNIIAHNLTGICILEYTGSYANTITQNSIFLNQEEGIQIDKGAVDKVSKPRIIEYDLVSGILKGFADPNSTIEIFSDSLDEGRAYEGSAITDETGAFTFSRDFSFVGPNLTTTFTDTHGATSPFSESTREYALTDLLQVGNFTRERPIETYTADELDDNRIASIFSALWQLDDTDEMAWILREGIIGLGLKRTRITINNLEYSTEGGRIIVDYTKPEMSVIPEHDAIYKMLHDAGIETTYTLIFWDKEGPDPQKLLDGPRFQTDDQVERYLEFVRFIVSHFRDRVNRFEIWNEPNLSTPGQEILLDDYIKLVRRAVPVIREEYPEAMIQVGGTSPMIDPKAQEYLFGIIRSDIMPLVDVVSWHPMYHIDLDNPDHTHYYSYYPKLVREIKATAEAHGFKGEYSANEITWWIEGELEDYQEEPWRFSTIRAAKLYSRASVMHLGMDVSIGWGGTGSRAPISGRPLLFLALQRLCTILAGHEAIDLPVEIEVVAEPLAYCAFRYPNGDRILALWLDGAVSDEDESIPTAITFPALTAGKVTGLNVLHGIEQDLIFEVAGGNTVVSNLILKDYPVLIRLSDLTMSSDYKETVGDGFHRLYK